jgi:hypothetical protein
METRTKHTITKVISASMIGLASFNVLHSLIDISRMGPLEPGIMTLLSQGPVLYLIASVIGLNIALYAHKVHLRRS